ncbi:MAG: 5-(carboxyamino)imidazole ribonucleotide synthase [Firmicutes bacterium]|nr:5-(carboxyamino)imidazole ribonucleotide synthase [Bacillota bacterium]
MINNIKTIGIVGGGQLGKMMILDAKRLGFRIAVLDPAKDCPCHAISDEHIVKGFDDLDGYLELAKKSDVITYEFEHINVAHLEELVKRGHTIYPSVASLKVIQDKLWQKEALSKAGIAVPKFEAAKNIDDLYAYYDRTQKPFFLKSRRDGYDGKGNYMVRDRADIAKGYERLIGKGAKQDTSDRLMIEELAHFEKEVSVIATRGQDGECVIYPIAENVHKNSILDTTVVPAAVSKKIVGKIMDIAKQVMECFGGVGTFCAELFVNEKRGEVMVNEVAPRVHNTGHYTIEAVRTSQFENHIRAIAGLGLGSTEMVVGASIMKNIIGGDGQDGVVAYTGIEQAYKISGVNVHIYGKNEVKEGRKMGHMTMTGKSVKDVWGKLDKVNVETTVRSKNG